MFRVEPTRAYAFGKDPYSHTRYTFTARRARVPIAARSMADRRRRRGADTGAVEPTDLLGDWDFARRIVDRDASGRAVRARRPAR